MEGTRAWTALRHREVAPRGHGFRVHSFRGLLFVRDFFALSVESSFFRIPMLNFVIAYCRTRRTPAGRICTTVGRAFV